MILQLTIVEFSLGDLGQISEGSPPFLDQASSKVYTDDSGNAVFSTKFISGTSQTCLLIFECNGVKSIPTRPIQLINSVSNITIINSSAQTLVY